MRFGKLFTVVYLVASAGLCAHAGVYVTSPVSATVTTPANGSANSPVHFIATGTSPACSKGVGGMGIYTAPYKLAYSIQGGKLDTNLALSDGTYDITVQEWDNCGWSSKATITLTVGSSSVPKTTPSPTATTFSNLQNQKGWSGYALLPPSWGICATCTGTDSRLSWSWQQGVTSPSMDGLSVSSHYGGGTVKWGDVLWNNHLIGAFSSQGISDSSHTLVPTLHDFTYDVYFWVKDASVSQAMEFDINQFTGGKSYIWGHECRIAGGHEWDVYDNVNKRWVPTGIACNPVSGAWNHLVINVQRTSTNQLLFKTITLNGNTGTVNRTYAPTSTNWNGVTINYQLDGNTNGTAYTVYLDKLNFSIQ
jgi:hypothetical protein